MSNRLPIPANLLIDLDSFARHYQGQRGFVLLRLHPRRSAMTWNADASAPEDLAAMVAAYDLAREYVVLVVMPDPAQAGQYLMQCQRRSYGGAIVSSA